MNPSSQPVATEGGHWYLPDGTPFYSIVGKNGNERAVTLRDARPVRAVPSVTTVTGILAKPGLINWQIDQALYAAITLPRLDGEDDTAFMARAKRDAQEQAQKARDMGTAVHGSLELAIQGRPYDAAHLEYVKATITACSDAGIDLMDGEAERSFAHPMGYGGKCDWHSVRQEMVLDFKTKDAIADTKRLAWPEHTMQLAAYRHGFDMPRARCFNVFIGIKDKRVVVAEHDQQDLADGWEQFKATLALWKVIKGYDPAVAVT